MGLFQRVREVDAHKATLIVGGVSTILSILLAACALFPNYWSTPIYGFWFVEFEETQDDQTRRESILSTAFPIGAAICSCILMFGNRMRLRLPYVIFLLYNVSHYNIIGLA
jgi:hypothetical protein